MADEKVRQVEHDFSGRPLRPVAELSVEGAEPYPSITTFTTTDGRTAVEEADGTWYEADAAGDPIIDRPIDKAKVIQ